MQHKILINLPTKTRPYKCIEVIKNTLNLIEDKDNYYFLVSFDYDDSTITSEVLETINNINSNIIIQFGDSKNKIDAINRDINSFELDWDILISLSDDMFFVKKGFDNIIRNVFNTYFPDTDGCPHFFDGYNKNVSTLSVLGRKYYDRFKYVYHPSYISLYCDDEQMTVAKILNKYYFYEDVIVEHRHPNNTKEKKDPQYLHTESFYKIDKINFQNRKANNFELNS